MSSDQDSPKTPVVYHNHSDDRDMLESLKGLSIKGFHDWYVALNRVCAVHSQTVVVGNSQESPTSNTPSSTNASLPTPPALRSSLVILASPEGPLGHAWYSEDRSIPPNAPLLKDMDSFTDGTGQGSFDFALPTGGDDVALPLIFHPADDEGYDDSENVVTPSTAQMPNSLALDLLPSPSNPTDAVLAWIEGVSATTPAPDVDATSELTPKKRRRSFTQDGDTEERRTRAWSPLIETPTPQQECPQSEEEAYPFDVAICETPG